MENWVTKNEIATHTYENATAIAKILLEENYVVMISLEDNIYIVNYVWSERGADRNDVVFEDRGVIEEEFFRVERK